MFERFTQQALSVLAVAQQEAAHHRCAYIGTEHLLVGLVADPESLSAQILQASGVSPEIVRAAIEAAAQPGPLRKGAPPFTPGAKKSFELALREALTLGHNYVGTQHLLVGVLREEEGAGASVLTALGVDLVEVRRGVREATGTEAQQPATAQRLRRGPRHPRGPFRSPALTVTVQVDGRSAAHYVNAFEALAEMLAQRGTDLSEIEPSAILIQAVARRDAPGIRVSLDRRPTTPPGDPAPGREERDEGAE
ncbi:MAG: Clp protease N-terminal domain-containing protein [Acidimicrobiales bacterium]|jgi:ATP-dependent Clp protease ATP-binding subunit ClpC